MTDPKISIVVPTYNQAQYLRACLDSIWFQQYPNLEVILVNDGSTDSTAQVIAEFQKDLREAKASFAASYDQNENVIRRIEHPRYPQKGRSLIVIDHCVNKGLAPALNTGFRACTGEYCTYVPSDDICYPHMCEELAAPLHAGADFAYSNMLIVDDRGNIQREFTLPPYSFENCFANWYFCGVSKLYRTDLHARFGYYNETLLAHDHELFQRFAINGAMFAHVNKPLMGVRAHDGIREVDIHAPQNWNRLLEESKNLVIEARAVMAAQHSSDKS